MKFRSWLLPITHIASLTPLALLLWNYWRDQLTVNPIQKATLLTGWYALVWLILSLACTPLNSLLGWRWVIPLRRWLGLYALSFFAWLPGAKES